MQISAPIHVLKRKAKLWARKTGCALHQALDEVATREGYRSWSHLSASIQTPTAADRILSQLQAGDLCLLGARPGQGKTRVGLEIAAKAARRERKGYVFSLEYHQRDVADRFADLGLTEESAGVAVDTSDEISADYIVQALQGVTPPPLLVVDYLQLLDQKRTNPGLEAQMRTLRGYVKASGATAVVISQIDRSFDLAQKAMPDCTDVRLPNPVDLSVFDRHVFLHDGQTTIDQAA